MHTTYRELKPTFNLLFTITYVCIYCVDVECGVYKVIIFHNKKAMGFSGQSEARAYNTGVGYCTIHIIHRPMSSGRSP